MNAIDFPFSDTIAGYVTNFDGQTDTFSLRTPGGKEFDVRLKGNTYAGLIRNLGDPYADCTGQMREMLRNDCFVFVYGIYYPESGGNNYEAEFIVFAGRKPGDFTFEGQDWWVRQVHQLAEFYLLAQFQGKPVDYRDYRTTITTERREAQRSTIVRKRTPYRGWSTGLQVPTCLPAKTGSSMQRKKAPISPRTHAVL